MNFLLKWLGLKIVYVCDWGTYHSRYDGCDYHFGRPIHKDMGTAPPWAKLKVRQISKGVPDGE